MPWRLRKSTTCPNNTRDKVVPIHHNKSHLAIVTKNNSRKNKTLLNASRCGKWRYQQIKYAMNVVDQKIPFGGESTLCGGQKCCQIVLFSKGVHVWSSSMVILEHIFLNFLHNMVDHNINNSIEKIKSNLYCVIAKYICGKRMYIIMY
jgi:hypothetical protein